MYKTTDAVGQVLSLWQFQSCCECRYITSHKATTGVSWCLYCSLRERMFPTSIVTYEKSDEYLVNMKFLFSVEEYGRIEAIRRIVGHVNRD